MNQPTLFEMDPVYAPPVPKLSRDRKRTLRQHALVDAGIHPLARRPIRPDLGTCGDCRFRKLLNAGNRSYPKCTFDPARLTHSAGTDCRAWWPACGDHEKKDNS